MDRLDDFRAFVAVVDKGSLTRAARQLDRSLQSVSRSLAALFRRLKTALTEIEDAKLEAANLRTQPSGLMRITASTAFAPLHLMPAIAEFLIVHPKVEIDLELSDLYVDVVEHGFDLAVRIGEMPDSSLRSKWLADLRRVVFAAPNHFAEHGRPKRPEDLRHHQCIVRTAARDGDAWPFTIDGKVKAVKVTGRFRASAATAANEGAVLGLGIANAPLWQVRTLLDRGLVELVLTRFEPPRVPVHAVWAATRVPSAKVQMFVDFLAARFKAPQL